MLQPFQSFFESSSIYSIFLHQTVEWSVVVRMFLYKVSRRARIMQQQSGFSVLQTQDFSHTLSAGYAVVWAFRSSPGQMKTYNQWLKVIPYIRPFFVGFTKNRLFFLAGLLVPGSPKKNNSGLFEKFCTTAIKCRHAAVRRGNTGTSCKDSKYFTLNGQKVSGLDQLGECLLHTPYGFTQLVRGKKHFILQLSTATSRGSDCAPVSAVIDKAPGANQLVSWGHYSLHCQTNRHASVAPNTVKVRGQFAKDLMPRAKSGFQAFADSVNSYESGILLGSAFYNRCSKHCIYQCLTWTSDSYRGNYAFVEEDAAKRQHHCKRESKSTPHRGTFLYSNPVGWVRKWYGMVTILCRRKNQIHWHLEVSLPSPHSNKSCRSI